MCRDLEGDQDCDKERILAPSATDHVRHYGALCRGLVSTKEEGYSTKPLNLGGGVRKLCAYGNLQTQALRSQDAMNGVCSPDRRCGEETTASLVAHG